MDIKKIEEAHKLGETLSMLLNFTSGGGYDSRSALFSKKYLLTKILGFTEEEYQEMQNGLMEEIAERKLKKKQIEARLRKKEAECDFVDEECVGDDYCLNVSSDIGECRPIPLTAKIGSAPTFQTSNW